MATTNSHTEILNSWKEIAVYLNRGVRTVQRWEAELGLPVRRPRQKHRSAVIAMRSEIDQWLRSGSERPAGATVATQILKPKIDSGGWQFLMTEVECGLTFAHIATTAHPDDKAKIQRNIANAHKAYYTITKFAPRVAMSGEASAELNAGLARLRSVLQELGTRGGGPESRAPESDRASRSTNFFLEHASCNVRVLTGFESKARGRSVAY